MRRLLFFILLLCSVSCYAQFFVGNDDYVYAVGKAKTQVEAENAALLSLANTISIKVTNVSSYTVTENSGKVSENYRKDIGTNSSIVFGDEVQTYVETDKKSVTVYKYINKKEYVKKQKNTYYSCLARIDSLLANVTQIKHCKGLVMGQYYIAYCALDNSIMDAYSENNIELKAKLLKLAEKAYNDSGRFGYVALINKEGDNRYYVRMLATRTKGMQGFEYLHNGKWEMAPYFYFNLGSVNIDGTSDAFSDETTPRCVLYSPTDEIYIRYIYEIKKDGKLYKMEVPENWYFRKIKVDTTFRID